MDFRFFEPWYSIVGKLLYKEEKKKKTPTFHPWVPYNASVASCALLRAIEW